MKIALHAPELTQEHFDAARRVMQLKQHEESGEGENPCGSGSTDDGFARDIGKLSEYTINIVAAVVQSAIDKKHGKDVIANLNAGRG